MQPQAIKALTLLMDQVPRLATDPLQVNTKVDYIASMQDMFLLDKFLDQLQRMVKH